MRVNPGGSLAPEEVVGRDRFIKRLWRILERQSLVLTAERRMGKTSVIRKMSQELPGDELAIFRDLEGTKSSANFVQGCYRFGNPVNQRRGTRAAEQTGSCRTNRNRR